MKFKNPSLMFVQTDGRRTSGQAQSNMPLQLFKVGGIINVKVNKFRVGVNIKN